MSNPFMRYTAKVQANKPVESIDVEFIIANATGDIWVTDIMLQDGGMITGWAPSSEEMLIRPRDQNGNIVPKKHYNCVIRGSAYVIIPNTGGMTMTSPDNNAVNIYQPPQKPATTGLDLTNTAINERRNQLVIETYSGSRRWYYAQWSEPGDVVQVNSATHQVTFNGDQTNDGAEWAGAFLTCPYGDVIYSVSQGNTDAGQFIFEIEEWCLSGVTW
ncbi:hypothetical protein GCM10025857_06680 [Alicyclobacillus contaminans]|uniref:hypothetical protein n=1 Tax=Alicyclobacillus contaminans TaxID=392016 RepID=UPI0004066E3C|nr:hypothetical protein [Alicyclobacillus contaminans]GMA49311.1 hypothetical protein GCM10025857_06680 [Alicyclobacillus contaminans]